MTTKPTAKVRKAFELLRKHSETMTIKEAAEKAGCSRSAIYRSSLYAPYMREMHKANMSDDREAK